LDSVARLWGVVPVLATVLVAGLTACGSADPPNKSIAVYAAASLKKTFTAIGEQFKTDNPGTFIDFNFAGSSDLVTQLTQGAIADVFASADAKAMDRAAQAGLLAGDAVNFASNTLVIAVAPGNPKNVASFAELDRPDLAVVVCARPVPCGSATQRIEDSTGIQLNPVSEEGSVTDVLNKVASGQADAGLVYVTDALGAGDKVTTVKFTEAGGAVNTCAIAVLKSATESGLARKFVALVTGEAGQTVLSQAGFAKP
jgi:molybdate transport system substrate-binding protein